MINKANQLCVSSSLENGQNKVTQSACDNESAQWVLDYTNDGQYRLVNTQGLFLTQQGEGDYAALPWRNNAQQQWKITTIESAPDAPAAWVTIANQASISIAEKKNLAAKNCAVANTQDCTAWRIQPLGNNVISSIQNGKVVSLVSSKKQAQKIPAIVELNAWNKQVTQGWKFVHTEQGFYSIQNANKQCVGVTKKSIVPGMALVAGDCGDKSAQWSVEFLANGTQKLSNRQSGLVFDVASCGVANHTPLAQAPYLNNLCQQFRILPVF